MQLPYLLLQDSTRSYLNTVSNFAMNLDETVSANSLCILYCYFSIKDLLTVDCLTLTVCFV